MAGAFDVALSTISPMIFSALGADMPTALEIRNPDATPFRAVAILPVGGQARIAGQPAFVPPWAA